MRFAIHSQGFIISASREWAEIRFLHSKPLIKCNPLCMSLLIHNFLVEAVLGNLLLTYYSISIGEANSYRIFTITFALPPRLAIILYACNNITSGEAGSNRGLWGNGICGSSTLTSRAAWNSRAAKEDLKWISTAYPPLVLHAPQRPSRPLGDDSSPRKPVQGR